MIGCQIRRSQFCGDSVQVVGQQVSIFGILQRFGGNDRALKSNMGINQQISDDYEVSVLEIGVPLLGRSEGEMDSIPAIFAVILKFCVAKLHHGMVQLMKANVWQPLAVVRSQLFSVAMRHHESPCQSFAFAIMPIVSNAGLNKP